MTHMVVGLGNPGARYENTRHNAGFLTLDVLAGRWGVAVKKLKWNAAWASKGETLLLKPQTFMNLSGRAVRDAAAFYKLPPERIIVVQDDIALEPGRLRIRRDGTDGGHNGVGDILYHLQSDAFLRVKIGVGGVPHPDMDTAGWVLSGFSREEAAVMENAIGRAADAVECLLQHGADKAMNLYNGKSAQ